jgi:hypothetical protein
MVFLENGVSQAFQTSPLGKVKGHSHFTVNAIGIPGQV